MKIEIRNDVAVISGYVNAVGRDSRPITDVRGKFVEQIEPGAFRASLERSENVDLLLNHDKSNVYASTRDGSLKLTEDSIGLRAEAVLSDTEMIRKARSGEFRGWSFGMYVGDSAMEERAEGIPRRHVKSLNMFEVSLIDKSRIPCYVGTSVECRAEGEDVLAELRYSEEEPEIVEEERSEPEPVDYSAVDDVISELRYGAVDNVIAELRYNPYHDPSNGRFTSGGGGGGGGFSNRVTVYVEKGQKGNKQYIVKGNDGNYYKYDNRSDVGEDYGIEIDLKYAQEMASKFGNMKYGGTVKSRNLFDQWSNEAKTLSAELEKLRTGRRGQMNMLGQLVFESSRAFDPVDSVIEELRYNPYHDPSNGRFCSGGGGGGGVLYVGKGQKGKGVYVVPSENFEKKIDISYEPDVFVMSVPNKDFSVGVRQNTATESSIKRIVANTLAEPTNTKSESEIVESVKADMYKFSIQVPKYSGTPKQVQYAKNLAEAYVTGISEQIMDAKPLRRSELQALAKQYGFEPTKNSYAKYRLEHSSTLKAIQNTNKASDVIELLKDKVNPNKGVGYHVRNYMHQYPDYIMQKGDWT